MPDPSATIDDLLAHAGWLRELARRLVGEAGADDALQEVWLRVARRPPEGLESPRGWLASLLRSVAHRRRLRGEAARAREREVAAEEALPSAAEVAARAEAQRRLVEAVLALDEPYRRTLLLHFFEGLSPSEIARRGGEPGSTIRNRLARGLALLRRRFDGEEGGRESWLPGLVLLAAPERAAAPAALLPLGALLMLKPVALAAAALVVLLAVWRPWSAGDAAPDAAAPLGPEVVALEGHAASGAEALPPAGADALREAELVPAPVAAGPAPGTASGRVVDPSGAPVVGATVYAGTNTNVALALRSDEGVQCARAETDADGAFRIDLGGGAHVLTARAEGFAPSEELELELAEGAGRADLELALRAGATVRGVVHGLDELPVAGRHVQIASPEGGEFLAVETDEGGAFAFTALRPGPWSLATFPGEEELAAVGSKTDVGTAMEHLVQIRLALEDGAVEELVLGLPDPGGVRVSGELRRGGEPTRGLVYWRPKLRPLERKMAQADADGRFEIELPHAGEWAVLGRPAGVSGAGVERHVVIDDARAEAEVVLDLRGATLTGRVLGPEGTPREDVRVGLAVLDGAPHRPLPLLGGEPLVTDADGRYAFELLPPGRYAVVVLGSPDSDAGPGLSPVALEPIEVDGDGEFDAADVLLEAGASVTVRVLDAAGRPVRGAALFFHDGLGLPLNPLSFLRTDEAGEARTPALSGAPLTVTAIHRDGASLPRRVSRGAAEASAPLELTLGEARWLALDPGDAAVGPAQGFVEIRDAGGRRFGGLCDLSRVHDAPPEHPHGERMLLGPLPLGVYEVRVVPDGGAARRASVELAESAPGVVLVAPR